MAGVVQLVSRFPAVTGLPEDVVNNVIHVGFPGVEPALFSIQAMAARMVDFWTTDPGPLTNVPGRYLADSIDHNANQCAVLAYVTTDLSGATDFGSPVHTDTFTCPAILDISDMPQEVCVALSFHGDLTDVPAEVPNPTPPPNTFRPAQRRRGRMFIGPLCVGAGAQASGLFRPTATMRTDITLAFAEFCQLVALDGSGEVAVWSKADAAYYPVVAGWMDDAWDTQRRRGLAATTRTSFTV